MIETILRITKGGIPLAADLHAHTYYSDAADSPETLVNLALKQGLSALAVTDHDTFEGNRHARELAKGTNLTIIPGVEVSTFDYQRGNKAHLLVYYPKYIDGLQMYFDFVGEKRRRAGEIMAERAVKRYGLRFRDIDEYARHSGVIFKQHIMAAMIDDEQADSIYGDKYDELFGENGTCIEPILHTETREIIVECRRSGGTVVMAHPGTYHGVPLMKELAEKGLIDGIELHHPRNSPAIMEEIRHTAAQFGLFITGGSDYHGAFDSKPTSLGDFTVDDTAVRLLERKEG